MMGTYGGTVPLEDIVGRDEVVERLLRDLERVSLTMNDMRRIGKSSVMRLLESRMPPGWVCVRTTVQDATSTTELVELTLQKLITHAGIGEKAKEKIRSLGKNVTSSLNLSVFKLEISPQENAFDAFRSVLKSIDEQLERDDKRLLIIWDEFPDAIRSITAKEGTEAAADVMHSFRAFREKSNSGRIRWLLTGSVGFHHVLRTLRGRKTTINDLTSVALGPISPDWACWMAECLLLGIGKEASPEQIKALAGASGGIPIILELMVKYIRDENASLPHTPQEAEALMVEAAASPEFGSNLAPFVERVEEHYGEYVDMAYQILDRLARNPMSGDELAQQLAGLWGANFEQRSLDNVLDLLIADYYLSYDRKSGLYQWLHTPLRVIWNARRRNS
jgi:hypothetical protein